MNMGALEKWRKWRARINVRTLEKRHNWAKRGLCGTCGNKRAPNRKTCEKCLKRNRDVAAKELAYRIKLNVCIDCLGEKGPDGTTVRCNPCRDIHNARFRVYKDKKRAATCDSKHTRSPQHPEADRAPIPASSPYIPSVPSNQSESRQQLQ